MNATPQVRMLSADDAQAFSNLRREVVAVDPVGLGLSQDEDLTRTLRLFNPRPADMQNTAESEEPGSRFPGDGDAPSGC